MSSTTMKFHAEIGHALPISLSDPFSTTWYHGTKASPFPTWHCPPPALSPADVPHTGIFFATNRDFAEGAGSNLCTVKLHDSTRLIVPACRGIKSTALRVAVIESSPFAAHCVWLSDDATWAAGWSNGEVMRFSIDLGDRKAAHAFSRALAGVAANLKKIIKTPLPDDTIMEQAMTCIRRSWIEQLVCEAKKLRYQAIHGAEVDHGSSGNSAPLAQEWLAVMDASVITAPGWQ